MPIYRGLAEEINKDPMDSASPEDMLKEFGMEPPKEEVPKDEVQITPEEIMAKATPENKSFFERLFQNAQPEFAVSPGGVTPIAGTPAEKAKPGIGKATVQGTVGIAENLAQLSVDSFNAVTDYFGITENELSKPHDIDWKSKFQSPDDNVGTQLMAGLVEYLAPGAAAAKAFKYGKLAAGGINVAIDSLAMDPKQERLADLISDSAPELRDWAVVGNFLKYLEHNDKDSNWEGRFKNGLESLIINSVFLGAPEVVKAIPTEKLTAKTTQATEGAKRLANAFYEQIKTRNAAKAVEETITATPKAAVTTEAVVEAAPRAPMFSSPFLKKDHPLFGTLSERAMSGVDELIPRTTHPEIIAKGEAILKDEKAMASLLARDPSVQAYTPEEVYALTTATEQAGQEITLAARNVDNMTSSEVVELLDAMMAHKGAAVTEEGVGRVAGQALESRKIEPDITVSEFKLRETQQEQSKIIDEAFSKLTPEQKDAFSKEQLKLMGGEEKARKLIKMIGNLDANDIQKAKWIAKVSKEGTLPKMERMLMHVMYNNMLGIGTSLATVKASAITTFVNSVDKFAALGARSFLNTDIYRSKMGLPLLTAEQKAAHSLMVTAAYRGYMEGTMRALGGIGRSLKMDRLGIKLPENVYATTKLDMGPRGIKGLTQLEKFGIVDDASFQMKTFGHLMNASGIWGTTTKLVGKSDEFFGGINYYARLSELVAEDLIANKIPLENFEQAYARAMADPKKAIHDKAYEFAQRAVMAKEAPEGSFVRKYITDNNFTKILFPFSNVTYNSIRYSLDHSPLKAIPLFSSTDSYQNFKRIMKSGTQIEKDEAIAQILVGTTAVAGLAGLSALGFVNGAQSPNWRIQAATAESGKGYLPYSIGGISFEKDDAIRPWIDLGNVLGTAHKYMEAEQYGDFSVHLTASLMNFFTANQLVENIADFTDIYSKISNGELSTGEEVSKYMANFAGRFFPKMGREGAQLWEQYKNGDAYKRQLKETGENLKGMEYFLAQVKNQFKADIPEWNQDLAVDRNILGEPQLIPDGFGPDPINMFRTNTGAKSAIMTKLEILAKDTRVVPGAVESDAPKLNIQKPTRFVRIPFTTDLFGVKITIGGNHNMSFEMTPEQHDQYMQYYGNIHKGAQGPSLRQRLETALKDDGVIWKGITKTQSEASYRKAIGEVTKIFTEARQRANYYIMQDPEFRKQYKEKLNRFENEQKQFIRSGGATLPSTMLGQ